MRVCIIGGSGMLGMSLVRTKPRGVSIVWEYGRSSGLGIQDREYRSGVFNQHPDAIINCSAMHDVNSIEADVKAYELAYDVNGSAVTKLSKECSHRGTYLVHISTDYVFNEPVLCPSEPIDEDVDVALPFLANKYAYTKIIGEQAIQICPDDNQMVVRTSALFGPGMNFVNTMLSLNALNRELNVVYDQYTSPTYTRHLAQAIWYMVLEKAYYPDSIIHIAAQGFCSWHDFASCILRDQRPNLNGVTTEQYLRLHPETAPRPKWSVLGTKYTNSLPMPHWRYGLHEYLQKEQLP